MHSTIENVSNDLESFAKYVILLSGCVADYEG